MLFRRRKLYFCALLGNSSEVTNLSREKTLSRIINFSKVTILKTSFSNSLVISVFLPFNLLNLSTCFEGFSGFLQQCSTGAKSSNAKKICIRKAYAKDTCIKDVSACTSNIYIKDTGTKTIYIKSTCIRGTCFSGACIGGASTNSASIVGFCARKTYIGND